MKDLIRQSARGTFGNGSRATGSYATGVRVATPSTGGPDPGGPAYFDYLIAFEQGSTDPTLYFPIPSAGLWNASINVNYLGLTAGWGSNQIVLSSPGTAFSNAVNVNMFDVQITYPPEAINFNLEDPASYNPQIAQFDFEASASGTMQLDVSLMATGDTAEIQIVFTPAPLP